MPRLPYLLIIFPLYFFKAVFSSINFRVFFLFYSLSENQSLLTMPPWQNPSLVTAIVASFLMHFVILYFKVANVSWENCLLDFNTVEFRKKRTPLLSDLGAIEGRYFREVGIFAWLKHVKDWDTWGVNSRRHVAGTCPFCQTHEETCFTW